VTPTKPKRYAWKFGSLAVLLGILFATFATSLFAVVDDAWISFRYAHNLVYHGELVFNTGERVEGITNLLWTLILAAAEKGGLELATFSVVASVALIVFMSFRLWQLGPVLGATYLLGALSGILLILTSEARSALTMGLEGALFAALLTELVFRYSRQQYSWAFFLAGLMFMTRPEGAFFILLLIALIYYEHRTLAQARAGIVLAFSIAGLVTGFRLIYYGSPVPNSIIAKSFPLSYFAESRLQSMVASYVAGFVLFNLHFVVIFALSIMWLLKSRENGFYTVLLCVLGIAFSVLVIVRNGGDWMSSHRLFMNYSPLFVIPAIIVFRQKGPLYHVSAFVCLFYLLVQYPLSRNTSDNLTILTPDYPLCRFECEVTTRLGPILAPDDVISAEAIGYISYHLSTNPIHDPIGLTDPYLAQHGIPSVTYGKSDILYTFRTIEPAVMVWHYAGHLQGVPNYLLSGYESFCYQDCDNWRADLVMVRRDRAPTLAKAFADWQKVEVETDGIRPLPNP
jgi:hypothetical protein